MEISEDSSPITSYINYDDIPPLPSDINQQELLNHINSKFTSKIWTDNIEAINYLRQINKSYPQSSNQVCEIFWNSILQALETPKTAVCKTMLVCFQEIFVQVNNGLNDAIIQFVTGSMIHKTQHTSSVIRMEAQKAFEFLTSYCIKESLIVAICSSCMDKNPKVSELAFKSLEKVLGAVNQYMMHAQADTFKAIFTALKEGLTGKRTELKKHASVIVKGLYEILGDGNFTHLIQIMVTEGILEDKDIENIKQSFEPENNQKQPRIGEMLSRKRKLANAETPEQFYGF